MPQSPRVVLDTNVFISGLLFRGKPREILRMARDNKIQLVVSPPIFDELKAKLRTKFRFSPRKVKKFFRQVQKTAEVVDVSHRLKVVRVDPIDDVLLETALRSKSKLLVSGGHRLLKLKKYKSIEIVTPAKFLQNVI